MPRFRPDLPLVRPRPMTLADAVALVAVELHHIAEALSHSPGTGNAGLVTTEQFTAGIQKIMSAISEFAARQSAFNDRLDTAVAGVSADVAALNAKIEELQNTPGEITPEDQALLDDIEARSDAITTKLEALDALTPPAVPVTP